MFYLSCPNCDEVHTVSPVIISRRKEGVNICTSCGWASKKILDLAAAYFEPDYVRSVWPKVCGCVNTILPLATPDEIWQVFQNNLSWVDGELLLRTCFGYGHAAGASMIRKNRRREGGLEPLLQNNSISHFCMFTDSLSMPVLFVTRFLKTALLLRYHTVISTGQGAQVMLIRDSIAREISRKVVNLANPECIVFLDPTKGYISVASRFDCPVFRYPCPRLPEPLVPYVDAIEEEALRVKQSTTNDNSRIGTLDAEKVRAIVASLGIPLPDTADTPSRPSMLRMPPR